MLTNAFLYVIHVPAAESAIVSRKSVAQQGQFPEAAAVLVQDQFVCSASIIADDAVITAAVCLGVWAFARIFYYAEIHIMRMKK